MIRLRFCMKNLINVKSVNYEDCRYIKHWVAPTQKEITRRKKKLPVAPEPMRSNFIEWNREAELYAFNKRLSEQFQIPKLNQAFTHKSYIYAEEKKQEEIGITEPKLDIPHNQELIETGRRITCEIVTRYLLQSMPTAPDVAIAAFYNYLMSEEILAQASLHIGTKDIILTEENPVSEETKANTFLALVAALAESVNIDHASTFVRDFLIVGLAEKDLSEIWCPEEPLHVLNEVLCKERRALVEPRIIRHTGKNTILAVYQIGLYSDKKFLGSGYGQTIEEAKNIAAVHALHKMFGLLDSSRTLRYDKQINMS